MKPKLQTMTLSGILMLILLACNLPTFGVAEISSTPTPNATMTALFASGVAGSLTPPPAQEPTSTPPPTATAIPPTSTATPTNTSIPGSPTPPPTITAPPTLTPGSGSGNRPGAAVTALYFSTPPTINGDWDDWGSRTQYPAAYVVYGASNWSGSSDLESSFRVGWDANNLYVASKVRDDIYVQNGTGGNIYKGDSLEILLDNNLWGDFYVTYLTSDDFQLGISPGNPDVNGTREAYLWYPKANAGSKSVQIASLKTSDGYTVEVAIPWSVLGTVPYAGLSYGFAFSVSDNDSPGTLIQQSMVSSSAYRHLTNPTTWGTLLLQ